MEFLLFFLGGMAVLMPPMFLYDAAFTWTEKKVGLKLRRMVSFPNSWRGLWVPESLSATKQQRRKVSAYNWFFLLLIWIVLMPVWIIAGSWLVLGIAKLVGAA